MSSFAYPKSGRLSRRKQILMLFREGQVRVSFPLLLRFLPQSHPQHQLLVSVPKRNFKKAVDRNRLKRQIRELYRLRKEKLLPLQEKQIFLNMGLFYVGKWMGSFQEMGRAWERLLNGLIKTYLKPPIRD
ncbi:MAG: ribonuclease P protein component [Cytophagales bacterium]|nr:ribonuclease P protein component [Cytophagales bacterium]